MSEGVRIDKWLWTVRIFKTRSQATIACKSGKVKVNDQSVKPSHEVKTGEAISISFPPMIKSVRVIGFPANRLPAKDVLNFMEDLTPQAEYDKLKAKKQVGFEFRQRGLGRPTKRQRREIEILKKFLDD
jgi:ribosome-associated heat shock protein Hsp15